MSMWLYSKNHIFQVSSGEVLQKTPSTSANMETTAR